MFAKFSADRPMAQHMARREVWFYRKVAPHVGIRIPRCYYAGTDDEGGHSMLLLEHLSDGRPGDSLAGCTANETKLLPREVAAMLARWWQSPKFDQWPWMRGMFTEPDTPESVRARNQQFRQAFESFREQFGSVVPTAVLDVADEAIERLPDNPRSAAMLEDHDVRQALL